MQKMKETSLELSFATPAFLGNAEQKAQWRTPPFKALLRQWWRVAKAKELEYDYRKLLLAENRLFGRAADEGKSTRSALLLKLNTWETGNLSRIPGSHDIRHPEVKRSIDSHLYLGYGPITSKGLARNAIAPSSVKAVLWLGFPEAFADEIQRTIQLMAWFGTLGSRSRNGWGSLMVDKAGGMELQPLIDKHLSDLCRPLPDCLREEWAHAIGCDTRGPLIWQTEPYPQWETAMTELAKIKIAFRTRFKFQGGGNKGHSTPQERHVIAYPVTNHTLSGLGQSARLANQIRFKVLKTLEGKFTALIFHLPCSAPDNGFLDRLRNEKQTFKGLQAKVWKEIHQTLDGHQALKRLGGTEQ